MVYKGCDKTYEFRKFKAIRSFGNDIRNNLINMNTAKDEQNHLTKYITEFKSKARPQSDSKFKKVKEDILNSAMIHLKGKEMVFKVFENEIFSRLEQ